MSRTLAVGDIHGCLRSLLLMEETVGFTAEDRIVLLGDYVDRGPDSRGVLDWIIDRRRTLNMICLRGNHDLVMLAARVGGRSLEVWKNFGGDAALESYGSDGRTGTLEDIPDVHWKLLADDLLPYWETETHLFVHATPSPDRPLSEQDDHDYYWVKFDEWDRPHRSGKTLICGHTSQKNGQPLVKIGGICIDTWACGGG